MSNNLNHPNVYGYEISQAKKDNYVCLMVNSAFSDYKGQTSLDNEGNYTIFHIKVKSTSKDNKAKRTLILIHLLSVVLKHSSITRTVNHLVTRYLESTAVCKAIIFYFIGFLILSIIVFHILFLSFPCLPHSFLYYLCPCLPHSVGPIRYLHLCPCLPHNEIASFCIYLCPCLPHSVGSYRHRIDSLRFSVGNSRHSVGNYRDSKDKLYQKSHKKDTVSGYQKIKYLFL